MAADSDSRKPDILIVMADQLTAALTGAYGHPVVQTPGMDRLGREGVRFDAAYSNCPLCTPARAALVSGRYVSRTRSYDNAGILPCDVPTFAHHLRLAGYEVVATGKMHFVGADQLHGFERRLTTDIYPSDFSWTSSWDDVVETEESVRRGKGRQIPTAGPCDWSSQLDYDEETHFRALEFLRQRRPELPENKGRRPFCLLASYSHPHPPYLAPRRFWDLYEGAEIELPEIPAGLSACESEMDRWLGNFEGVPDDMLADADTMRRFRRAYYGLVSYADSKLAELLDTLDDLGMRNDTATFFTSDHGDMLGERRLVEKRVFYEWSARVPLLASWPGRWAAGTHCAEPVTLVDLFPTLVELAAAPPPTAVDGRSFLDVLEGRPDSGPERVAVSEYHGEGVKACCFMVRRGPYKYIYIDGYPGQLFDLRTDPDELDNLAGQPASAEIEASLHGELLARFDLEAVAADVQQSQAEHALLRQAMREGERTHWDHQPFFDAREVWHRG